MVLVRYIWYTECIIIIITKSIRIKIITKVRNIRIDRIEIIRRQ